MGYMFILSCIHGMFLTGLLAQRSELLCVNVAPGSNVDALSTSESRAC